MARFACPSCSGQFEVDTEDLGKVVRCPHCGTMLGTGEPSADSAGHATPAESQSPPEPGQQPVAKSAPPQLFGPAGAGPPFGPAHPPSPRQANPAGAWSFVLAVIFYIGQIVIAAVLIYQAEPSRPGLEQRLQLLIAHAPAWVSVLGLALLVVLLLSFFLGLFAISRPNRSKGLATAGLILSGLGLLCGVINIFGSGR